MVSSTPTTDSVPNLLGSTPRNTNGVDGRTQSAKPLGNFKFLNQNYAVATPSCLIPRLNELFKSVCERYDIAVTNREKIDEALTLFKRVIDVDLETPLEECFTTWRGHLNNPRYTVSFKEPSGHVKDIVVRADEIPKSRRKAQKHMRDLLQACHLFLDQREFLQRHVRRDLDEIDRLAGDLQTLAKQSDLSNMEKKELPKSVRRAQDLFVQFPLVIDKFFDQIYSLVHDINVSVHVLQE